MLRNTSTLLLIMVLKDYLEKSRVRSLCWIFSTNCSGTNKENITSLTYLKSDRLGSSEEDRKAVFDLYCENEKGEKFIVELQKTKQKFFKDRTVYYSTFPIREQAQRGSDWSGPATRFELNAVYTIAILDFVFDHDKLEKDKFRYDVKLTDVETCRVFYDKLIFVYLEMPKFRKDIKDLQTRFDKCRRGAGCT